MSQPNTSNFMQHSMVKLSLFFVSVILYFVLSIPKDQPSIWSTFVKCAPIYALMFFVFMNDAKSEKEYTFSRKIILALLFSSIGDAFLIWPGYFPQGMAAFGIAHVFYISAFGFKPLRPRVGWTLYSFGVIFNIVAFPKLKSILVYGVPIYSLLLLTMTWRAIARVKNEKNEFSRLRLCSGIGAILFVISDALIAIGMFFTHIPNGQILIMSTYYIGQLGITLSLLDLKSATAGRQTAKFK